MLSDHHCVTELASYLGVEIASFSLPIASPPPPGGGSKEVAGWSFGSHFGSDLGVILGGFRGRAHPILYIKTPDQPPHGGR